MVAVTFERILLRWHKLKNEVKTCNTFPLVWDVVAPSMFGGRKKNRITNETKLQSENPEIGAENDLTAARRDGL